MGENVRYGRNAAVRDDDGPKAIDDNHLGHHHAKMPPSTLGERRKRLRQAFEQAAQFACEQRAHLFLIAGDLFDSPNPRNVERACVADAQRRLQDHRVTLIAC